MFHIFSSYPHFLKDYCWQNQGLSCERTVKFSRFLSIDLLVQRFFFTILFILTNISKFRLILKLILCDTLHSLLINQLVFVVNSQLIVLFFHFYLRIYYFVSLSQKFVRLIRQLRSKVIYFFLISLGSQQFDYWVLRSSIHIFLANISGFPQIYLWALFNHFLILLFFICKFQNSSHNFPFVYRYLAVCPSILLDFQEFHF